MAKLFSNLQIGRNLVAKNRIALSPMSMYSSDDGFMNDFHMAHYGARALGGAGIVFLEATAISKAGRGSQFDAGIYRDEHVARLRKITDLVHSQNALVGCEIWHSGRKGSTKEVYVDRGRALTAEEGAWESLGPSPIGYGSNPAPKEATLDDIRELKTAYKEAARRAHEAGFDIIHVHAGYGYLLNNFLSPYTNKRTDQYGGSFENRTRFVMEVLAEMQSVLPKDYPMMIRLSVADSLPEGEGWSLNDTIAFVKMLQAETGIVLVELVYGANVEHEKAVPELTVTPFAAAEAIRKECDIPLAVNGGIINPKWAETIVSSGLADMVVVGRAYLDDPNWPNHAAAVLGAEDVKYPIQYNWAIGKGSWSEQNKPGNNKQELDAFQAKNA